MNNIVTQLTKNIFEIQKLTKKFTDIYQYESLQSLDLDQLAHLQNQLKDNLEAVKLVQTTLSKYHDIIRKGILPEKMNKEKIEGVSYTGVGKVSLVDDCYVSIKKDMQKQAIQWLDDLGHVELKREVVHPQSLKSLLKQKLKEGDDIPENIFNVQKYKYTKIKRVKI